jgi:TetR/AcrR family transcriptional regulator
MSPRAEIDVGEPEADARDPNRKDENGHRRRRLLEMATEEFSEKGFAGARVDAIARRAQVNKQLVYYYFKSKLGLYNAVIGHMMESASPVFQSTSSEGGFAGRLQELARTRRRPVGQHWQRLLTWEALESGGRDIVREEQRSKAWQLRAAEVEDAIADGEVDDRFEADMLALAIVAVQLMPHVLPQVTKMVTGLLPSDEEFERRQERLLAQLAEHLQPQR